MPIENLSFTYSDGTTPQDLRLMRREVLEYHRAYGMPVVIKHAFKSDDVALGQATRDDTWDDVYSQGSIKGTGHGTGITGGYSDGAFTYITLSDTQIDVQSPDQEGLYKTLQPSGTAPWVPLIQDGDMIILVAVADVSDQVQITSEGDRFIVQSVQPVTLRGYVAYQKAVTDYEQGLGHMVSQNFQAIRIPPEHPSYQVPLIPDA